MTASRPDTPRPLPHLPEPSHIDRLPAGVSLEEFDRIRRAAHQLPQVTKPADYLEPHAPRFEAHLDELGLILLQKAAGTRPSRWIEPRLVPLALAQLAATGTGPEVRALITERTAALDAVGIVRHAGAFTRLVQDTLAVRVPDGESFAVTLPFRVPVDDAPVWRFYRDGDAVALKTALGAPPRHPQREAIAAHLERLVERSDALSPRELGSLLPRLQAECARPQRADDLMAACTRVQDRWEHRVTELDTLEGLNSELAFGGYPDTFPKARAQQRTVKLYVGPPNSGKTHAAFERLAQARDGTYLAPLRLLALEGRDRLVGRGVPCSLLTGEENVPAPGARFVSSTIEMVSTNQPVEVAVVDEAQMIFDGSRGWAWTQAIVAVPASELIVICSEYAVPAIEQLLGVCGERCTVRRFERKQHVDLLPRPVAVSALQEGDAVVAFSRREVLTLRDAIAANGRVVSVIYGALPPEVRRREAERFAGGESQILVATDAIGMGLNLPIRRVLFSTLTKFDGVGDRLLDESEVHQIAGRAGRFGIHEEGFTGVLELAEPTAARTLKELLHKQPKAPKNFKAPVAPNGWHVRTIASRMQATKLRDVLGVFVERLKLDDAHFAVAELDAMLALAESLDHAAAGLPLASRFVYAQAPVDSRNDEALLEYLDWARRHAMTGRAGRPSFLDSVDGFSRLDRIETALRGCTLWLWLDLRFPGVYGLLDEVRALRDELNDGIERQLQGKRPLAMRRGHSPGARRGRG